MVVRAVGLGLLFLVGIVPGMAQEKSVRPGINDSFKNPDVKKYAETFEGESREVFAKRKEILKAIGVKPGSTVADVGAGTGLYTRIFAEAVGPKGKVFAVDISDKFLAHITKLNKDLKIDNVTTVLCQPHSSELPANSVDLVYICDTYHHFEFPSRTMDSIHKALKPGGRVVLIDFRRVKGESSEWTMNHVRAGQEVFEKEILDSGFKKIKEEKSLLKDNYFVVFEKVEAKPSAASTTAPSAKFVYPIIEGFGGVVALPDAVDQPAKGTKVVFDVTAAAKETGKPLPGLERAALLMNLAGSCGLKAKDIEIVIVLHGEATMMALNDATYREKTGRTAENSDLIARLVKAGVRVEVCGQSLARKGIDPKAVRPDVRIAASALTAVLNQQQKGYATIGSH